MTRMNKLWRMAGGPGRPPAVSGGRVRARVNAALDASQGERKIYRRQRLCTALAAAVAALAVTGTAFAAILHLDALSAWFQGDTAPGAAYLDSEARSVSDGSYTLTVESAAADESSAYLVVDVTAHSAAAAEFLRDEKFISMDIFDVQLPSGSGGMAGVGLSFSVRELEAREGDSRRFGLAVDGIASAAALRVRCGYMDGALVVEMPLSPAPSVTVQIGASGTGVLEYLPASAVPSAVLEVKDVTLSAFTCHVRGESLNSGIYPRILVRLADGSIRTQSQMMDATGSSYHSGTRQAEYHYRFREIQELDNIASLIVFDTEYPLDGSAPTPVEHDPSLDPFTVGRMEPLEEGGGFSVPVRELTEGLGGSCSWDASAGEMTCVYRGVTVVLQAGSRSARVDGAAVFLDETPVLQDGSLAAPYGIFRDAWKIRCCVQREKIQSGDGAETIWGDWYVIP